MADGLINPWLPEPDTILHQALGKTAEECSELAGAVTRCLIQGYVESEPVTGKHNQIHVREEIADVLAVIDWLIEVRPELDARGSQRYQRKLDGFRKWEAILSGSTPSPNLNCGGAE
jgi:hypothetical protein